MNAVEDEIHFLFYCEFYQNSKEYRDFELEFGLNKLEMKSLPAEERWKRIWETKDINKTKTLAKFVYTALKEDKRVYQLYILLYCSLFWFSFL